jgi:hypothetical protein
LKLASEIADQPEEEANKEEAAVDTIEKMSENATNGNAVSVFSLIILFVFT